ncbi:ABC transporter substrate-binding protein [Haloferax namakaokahaiae]|uniref:ABC transporter substrate-binding protein n=1 Tax=Haloferax namakaokahaiae TaxID=1748331 RepID=A0ABD5ZD36_9EURY
MQPHSRRAFLKRASVASTIGAASLAGCTGSPGEGNDNGGGGDTDAGGDSETDSGGSGGGIEEIKVGVFAPYTGPFAPWGESVTTGSVLAKQDLEEEFGISIELVEYDTETNPSTALERMKRAVTSDGIDFAHGGISSAVCTSMGSWASDNGVSYIAQGASDSITGEACAEHMFSVYQSNTMMANAAGPEMAEQADSWYILYSDYVWGQTGQKVISASLEANGATVVGKDATPFPGDDYTQYINNVANSDADAVALIIPGLDARLATEQMMNKGLHEELTVMYHQFEDLVLWGIGEDAASTVDVGTTGWMNGVEGTDEFNQRIVEEGDTDPFARHYMAYTSLDQQVRAAMRAGSTDAAAITSELEGHQVSSPVNDIQPGTVYWRECDHQLIQPTHLVSGLETSEISNGDWKQWFTVDESLAGDDLARTCEETGCEL